MLRRFAPFLLLLILVGCNVSPTPTRVRSSTPLVSTPKPTNTIQLPAATSTMKPKPRRTATPETTLTPLPIPTLVLEGMPLPSGLIYLIPEKRWQDTLWQIDLNGKPTLIFDFESPHMISSRSPDGTRVLYNDLDKGGIWIDDVRTGEKYDLAKDLSRQVTVTSAQWWPGQPNEILLGSYAEGDDITMSNGYLTELDLHTSQLRVLDKTTLYFGAAISPDGKTVAYDDGGNAAWLYQEGKGSQAFQPQRYGLVADGKIGIGNASWSPDGKKLAWVVSGSFNGESQCFGVAVFDLQRKTSLLLHLYQIAGTDRWPPSASWSPDGQWLAIEAMAEGDDNGLWVAKVDGTEQHHLVQYLRSMTWSPDSHYLAFATDYPDFGAWLTKIGDWDPMPLALPVDAMLIDWVEQSSK